MEMPYSIRQVLAVVLICAGFVPVCSARTARRTAKRYSAKQLIAKIIASERKIHNVELHYDYIIINQNNHVFTSFDWGYEGGKEYYAGKCFARANREWDVPAHEKEEKSAFDGEKYYLLEENLVFFGNGQMERRGYKGLIGPLKPGYSFVVPRPTTILGYDISKGRRSFGEILRGAPKALVRRRPEVIDGRSCRVLEAIGVVDRRRTFDVRVWIDTERDFRPLKIERYHSIGGKNRWRVLATRIEKIKLEKIDSIWFPVDGIYTGFSRKRHRPKGMTEAEYRNLTRKQRDEVSDFIVRPNRVGPLTIKTYRDTVRINKGIDPNKFTIEFPKGCVVRDEFIGESYVIGGLSEQEAALSDIELIERIRQLSIEELIDIVGTMRGVRDITINRRKLFATIQRLVQIGSAAIPQLVEELDQTRIPQSESIIAFTLRAIGDPQAVPGLINALKKCGFSSDYGIGEAKTGLELFMKKHQMNPTNQSLGLGRPVREITIALERLTGHTEGHEHFYFYDEKGNRVYVYLDTPENRARTRKMLQAAAKRWRLWWEKNKQTVLKRDAQNRLNR